METDRKTTALAPIIPLLREKAEFALVFGSLKSGRIMPESDIDIGVYLKKGKPDFEEYFKLKGALSDASDRDVDLVILNACDIIIAMQIIANGELIINNNPGMFIRYKAEKISQYIDFKMSRKIIEENLLRGGIHA
jgi:predicted nucleotidyltransferase